MEHDERAGIPPEECTADLGAPDVTVLGIIRDLVVHEEPLVKTADFDSVLDPHEIQIVFTDGIAEAEWCRIESTWYTSGAYRFHYSDEKDVHWRFDLHPNPHSSAQHFHTPPDARSETAEPSCIRVEEPRLVTRVILKLWRRAYEASDFVSLNTATNPP